MSMLAGPRIKQKISADPRNLAWRNDQNNFGQKLMEKMGWTDGKGLGANEDGRQEPIKVSKKDGSRGVGCTKSYADNWVAHQDDFDSLLLGLNQDHGDSNGSASEPDSKKVQSLEEKSKKSKGRVHYMKFTKGKDLSVKSKEDLACVFGWKKSVSSPETSQPQSQDTSNTEASPDDTDVAHGVVTIHSGTSVQDYFARKMAELKRIRSGEQSEPQHSPVECETRLNGMDTSQARPDEAMNGYSGKLENKTPKKKKKKKDKSKEKCEIEKENLHEEVLESISSDDIELEVKDLPKKKKKKRKHYKDRGGEDGTDSDMERNCQETASNEMPNVSITCDSTNGEENNTSKRKRKKKGTAQSDEGTSEQGLEGASSDLENSGKEKTNRVEDGSVPEHEGDVEAETLEAPRKKRKKNKTKKIDLENETNNDDESIREKGKQSKKEKKNSAKIDSDLEPEVEPPKKKRKKRKAKKSNLESEIQSEINSTDETIHEKEKQSKKDNKKSATIQSQEGEESGNESTGSETRINESYGFNGSNLGEICGYGFGSP